MRIAALTASDAPQYRELMLEAYVQAADAFTSTAKERAQEPLSWWVNRIASASGLSQSFGAFQAEQLVGTVALEYSAKPKTQHSALVIGMYVKPAARRLGAGAMLMQAVIVAARAKQAAARIEGDVVVATPAPAKRKPARRKATAGRRA